MNFNFKNFDVGARKRRVSKDKSARDGPKEEKPTTSKQAGSAEANGAEAEPKEEPKLHPLETTWTMWYLENDRTKTWEEMQNEIMSVSQVERFWSLYNHIKAPSELKIGSDYSFFKKGIRPMWEDAANVDGGRWVLTLNKGSKTELNSLWTDVLLCLIGEVFDSYEEVCGAVVNVRSKNNKISVWTAHGRNKEAVLEIGHKLRDNLKLNRLPLQYELHKDVMIKNTSSIKAIYTL